MTPLPNDLEVIQHKFTNFKYIKKILRGKEAHVPISRDFYSIIMMEDSIGGDNKRKSRQTVNRPLACD